MKMRAFCFVGRLQTWADTHAQQTHTHTDIYISLRFFFFETSSTSCMTSWFCSSCCLVSLEFSFLSMTELIMTKTAIEYFKLTHPHNYMPACSLNQACVFWNSSIWQSGSAVGLMETVNNPHTCFVLYCCPCDCILISLSFLLISIVMTTAALYSH